MSDQALLNEILVIARDDLGRPQTLAQLAVIAMAVVVAWLIARRNQTRINERLQAALKNPYRRIDVLRFSIDGVRRLAFPIIAMALVVLGGAVLTGLRLTPRLADLKLLQLALTLLFAMAIVRLLVYVLRRIFAGAALIGTFERAIAFSIWLIVALQLTGLSGEIVQLLEGVRFPVGKSQVTLWDLLIATVSVLLTVLAALWVGSSIENRLMATTSIAANSRIVMARFVKAILLLLAVLVALSVVGIDLTVLSVFGGALGVGLGLGLQRIASNYVSGFIILLDKSLSIGDMIVVDKYSGAVSQINTRYTVIRALDGTETIVPNEMLVSTPVVNQSFSKVRVVVKVSVAYETDVDHAIAILEECARAQERVLADPAPGAFVTGFGADGIDLEVGFWVRDPHDGTLSVRSQIAMAVLRRFREENIAIPFPQRDIRITSMPPTGNYGGRNSAP